MGSVMSGLFGGSAKKNDALLEQTRADNAKLKREQDAQLAAQRKENQAESAAEAQLRRRRLTGMAGTKQLLGGGGYTGFSNTLG